MLMVVQVLFSLYGSGVCLLRRPVCLTGVHPLLNCLEHLFF
jgi:hypothetical protein